MNRRETKSSQACGPSLTPPPASGLRLSDRSRGAGLTIVRASFATPGKSEKPISVKIPLRPVDLDGLKLVVQSFRDKGEHACDTLEKLLTMLVRTELVSLFPLHHKRGLSLGAWELERMNGSPRRRNVVRNA
jgi:hypothetical protein